MSDQNLENTAEIGSIEDITNWQFEIPAYQRLYDWEELQILELLEDIQKAQTQAQETQAQETQAQEAKKGEYFIGNVVVSQESQENQENKYVLIDGQQRLTTLFLLGLCLSKTLQEKDRKDRWENFVKVGEKLRISMPLREMEEKALKQLIESNDSEDFTQKIKKCFSDLQINQKIPQALRCITEWIQNHCQNKKEFANFVYGNVKFVLVRLASNTDLNRFFVRMNNRGKQLEKHEILKARLLGKIEDQNKREYYAKIWDMCSEMDKYILQSQKDRDLSKQTKERATNVDGENSDKNAYTLENILKNKIEEEKKKDQVDQVDQEKFKSIVDFPTFLLHVAKLYQVETQRETQEDKLIAIDKDKLLDIICIEGDNGVSNKNPTEGNSRESNKNSIVLEDAEQVSVFINTLLLYRIVFDYFVIKKNQQKEENKDSYAILGLKKVDKYYQVSETPRMKDLAMLQNYLRVARTGEKQNYHHWLTNFLKIAKDKGGFINKEEAKGLNFDELLKKFQNNGNEKDLIPKLENEEVLIQELEKLDTQLALGQLHAESSQLTKLQQISDGLLNPKDSSNENSIVSKVDSVDFNKVLNQGTNTPHYWFYRLEYYLWKEGSNEDRSFDGRDFSDVAEDYYFRALDSIEHIHPQSKKDEWEKMREQKRGSNDNQENSIDSFGNLALISASFNSSLNNQDTKDKQLDLMKLINRNNVPSLKMWLIYASNTENKVFTWEPDKANTHQGEMINILEKSLKQKNKNGGGTKQ